MFVTCKSSSGALYKSILNTRGSLQYIYINDISGLKQIEQAGKPRLFVILDICVHTVESVVVGDFVFLFVLICVEAVEAVVGWWVSLGGGVASPPSREAGFRPHIINP